MVTLAKALVALAALALILAVYTNLTGAILLATAEGYSRASGNLALLAIAVLLSPGGRPSSLS